MFGGGGASRTSRIARLASGWVFIGIGAESLWLGLNKDCPIQGRLLKTYKKRHFWSLDL